MTTRPGEDSRHTRTDRVAVPSTTQTLNSVATAARMLKEFGKGDTQLGISQLARRVGVGKSTAHRVAWTLVAEGLLEKVEDTGLFRLTSTMRNLGVSAETAQRLHQAATTPLDHLRAVTDLTLHVAILDGADVLYVERREAPGALNLFNRVGGRNAAHVTSTGKVLLAFMEPTEQARLVDSMRLARKTPHTIVTRSAFLAELAQVRRQGYATNIFESEAGMISVAAPIRDRTGRVIAALSIVGPAAERDFDLMRPFVRPLLETTSRISHNLGFKRPPPT
ncbi:MAG: IclR family transcriptional regulator [Nocardioides sp.]